VTERQAEALEKLNQGIQESRRTVQQQTMELAQDYFGNSVEALRDQIEENRAVLESLPDQIPGGREEAFQAMFQELMDNYSNIEGCLEEAQQNVSDLDPEQIRRQEEVDATDAARREARERGVDLTKIEGTGADGRIIVTDVVEAAEAIQAGEGESEDGAAGAAQQAQDAAGQAVGQAQQVAGQATDQAGQVAGQAQEAAGQAAQQGQQAAQQGQQAAQQAAGGQQGGQQPNATQAAQQKAQELGVDLNQVQGTGAQGRITVRDVIGASNQ
jgi:pyruvate/2-oxoglutarate dehydrogenase complex dihydrolipoamide acyltransferase (E2) component